MPHDSHAGGHEIKARDLYGEARKALPLLKGGFSYAVQKFPKGINLAWGVLVQWPQ